MRQALGALGFGQPSCRLSVTQFLTRSIVTAAAAAGNSCWEPRWSGDDESHQCLFCFSLLRNCSQMSAENDLSYRTMNEAFGEYNRDVGKSMNVVGNRTCETDRLVALALRGRCPGRMLNKHNFSCRDHGSRITEARRFLAENANLARPGQQTGPAIPFQDCK